MAMTERVQRLRRESLDARVLRFLDLVDHVYYEALDLAVILEASDETLIRRVQERRCGHRMKEMTESDVTRFFADYADAFRILRASLATRGQRFISVDTDGLTPEEVFDEVQKAIAREAVALR